MKTIDNDFATFVQTNWSLVETDKLIWTPHMQIICDAFQDVVEGRNNRLIVNVPHGMSKSLLAAVFLPAWIHKVAGGRVGIVCDCNELARRDWRRSQMVTRENWPGQSVFGSLDWVSVDGAACAMKFDMLIVDVSNAPRPSKSMVDQVIEVWMAHLHDPKNGKVILIETRSEHGDVTGRLLAKAAKDEWRHICLPMAYDAKVAKEDFRTEEGQLLCPERWNQEAVDRCRVDFGERAFNAQYQQNPPQQTEAVMGISVTPSYPTDYAKHIADVAKRYKQGDLSVEMDVRKLLRHLEVLAVVMELEPLTQPGETE